MNNLQELQKLAGIDITESLRRTSEKIKGLDGPFNTNKRRGLYFDPKENRFYDRNSDHYVDLVDGEDDPRKAQVKTITDAKNIDEEVEVKEAVDAPRFDHAAYKAKVRTMSDDALRFTMKDAHEAIKANPDSEKAKSGYYADEINYCSDELHRRKTTNESTTPEKVGLLFDPNDFVKQMEKTFRDSVESISYHHTDADADRADKYKLPKDVKKACTERIAELKAAIDVEDDKGYNDKSIKEQAIECIEQILQNLSSNDAEGFKQSVIYLDTLMSILVDLMPAQLLKYLRVGRNYGKDPSTEPV
jgi:hypothetical protein